MVSLLLNLGKTSYGTSANQAPRPLFYRPFVYVSLRNIGRGMSRRRKSLVSPMGATFALRVKAAARRWSAPTAGSADDVSQGNGKQGSLCRPRQKRGRGAWLADIDIIAGQAMPKPARYPPLPARRQARSRRWSARYSLRYSPCF